MEKILIAEDDRILQAAIQKRLHEYKDRFEVIFTDNGEEAIDVLKQTHISLLVTDIVMPRVDGMALLSYVNNRHPHIPCIVMTCQPTEVLKDSISEDNLFAYFQKPFKFEEFVKTIFKALEQDIPNGTLRGISVASFLQMIQLEEKTCLFEVQSPKGVKGFFYFQNGVPYDAYCNKRNGEEAAYEIICMEKAEITFKNLPVEKIARRINSDLTGLIMEAFRRKDEAKD